MTNQHNNVNSPSLFSPIVLIAVGIVWLLANLGWLPAINWSLVWSLWPLALVFIGLNMIVRQAPRPLGALLSAIVGMLAVASFGYIILFSNGMPTFLAAPPAVVQQQSISYPLDGAERAAIEIEGGAASVNIEALTSTELLISGDIATAGELLFDTSIEDGNARIRLDSRRNSGPLRLNPADWNQANDEAWQIALNTAVPVDLQLDGGSGTLTLDLSTHTLQSLNIDGSSGVVTVQLPDGAYDVTFDSGSGASIWHLPQAGSGRYAIDGGSGQITLLLPRGAAAEVAVDGGSGTVRFDDRFERVAGDDKDGVWQTANYESAEMRLELEIDVGSGAISVQQPTGR